MAGLVPAIHDLRKLIIKVVPIWVLRMDQAHFPGSWPMFHISLALPGCANVIVTFGNYKSA
jgi:hypothetical protein